MWLICPTPSIICLPYYLRFLIFLSCLLVVDLVMKLLYLFWVINSFLYIFILLLHFLVLCGLCLFSTYGVSFGHLGAGYRATRVFDSGWMEYFGGQGIYRVLFNLGRANQWFQYNNLTGVVHRITINFNYFFFTCFIYSFYSWYKIMERYIQ